MMRTMLRAARILTIPTLSLTQAFFNKKNSTQYTSYADENNKIDIRGLPKEDLAYQLILNVLGSTSRNHVNELVKRNNGRISFYIDGTLGVKMDLSGDEIDPTEYDAKLKGKPKPGYTVFKIDGVQECVERVRLAVAQETKKQFIVDTLKPVLGVDNLELEYKQDQYFTDDGENDYVCRPHLVSYDPRYGAIDIVFYYDIEYAARILSGSCFSYYEKCHFLDNIKQQFDKECTNSRIILPTPGRNF